MSSINVSKDLINNIAEQENKKFIKGTTKLISQILGESIKDLSEKVSFISVDKVILQPANELISGAFIDSSNFVYLLGVQNIQLEINTSKKVSIWQDFKERLKWAWQNRKRLYKRKKQHRKKKDKNEEIDNTKNKSIDLSKYTIYSLTEDLQNTIIKYLSETSLVYLNGNILQIIGKDDFGANTKILIYVVNYDGTFFKYYAGKKKGFININIGSRVQSLTAKYSAVGENFIKILKIFNSLFYNTNGYICNQVFLESILCAVPEDLYYGIDIYKVFVKILNHLSIKSFKDIKSINDTNLTIFKDEVCSNSMLGFKKMMNKIFTK